jgi:transposase
MIKITKQQYEKLAACFPKQHGNVKHSNLHMLNAILFVLEQGCKWRALPREFGAWHTVYMRMRRWADSGVLERVFEEMRHQHLVSTDITALCLDSTSVKVHPDAAGARKKTGRKPSAARAAD